MWRWATCISPKRDRESEEKGRKPEMGGGGQKNKKGRIPYRTMPNKKSQSQSAACSTSSSFACPVRRHPEAGKRKKRHEKNERKKTQWRNVVVMTIFHHHHVSPTATGIHTFAHAHALPSLATHPQHQTSKLNQLPPPYPTLGHLSLLSV